MCLYKGLGPDALYMAAAVNSGGRNHELYRYTESGGLEILTESLMDDDSPSAWGSNPSQLTVFDGRLFFAALVFPEGSELFWYNGTGVPELVADTNPQGSFFPLWLLPVHGAMFMQGYMNLDIREELYRMLAVEGSLLVPPSAPALYASLYDFRGSKPRHLTLYQNDTLVFIATQGPDSDDRFQDTEYLFQLDLRNTSAGP